MARKPLALAKLSPPRLHDVFARSRLFEALDDALRRPVAWLCAQPGAGKTTLVASYLQARPRPLLWYQVDDGDADAASFVYHLRLAAGALRHGSPSLPLLTPEYQRDLRGFARRFFRALYATLPAGTLLVFDNFQEADDASPFHRVMLEAIAQLPDDLRIVIVSRAEPDGPYAPLLGSDTVALINADALRLTLDETESIARQRGAEADAAVLHERSHGWAAGLTLLLVPTRRAGGDAAGDDADSLQRVFGYFAQRVFDDAGAPQQQVLMALALLPRLTPALAAQVTGDGDAGRLLERCYRRHLFTDRRRVADEGFVYQFHALFRSFLLSEARRRLAGEHWHALVTRAAHALAADGQWEAALGWFAEAGDWAAYAATVQARAEALLDQGRQQSLAEALARLPPSALQRDPWLAYWQGRAWMHGQPERALPMLQASHGAFEAADDASGQLAAGAAIVQTLWYARLGWSEITPWVERLEPLLERPLVFPTRAVELLSLSALHAALSFCRLAHPAVLPMGCRLLALLDDDTIDWNQRLTTATHLMTWFHNAAEFELAHRLTARVDPLVDRLPASALNRSFWFTFRAIHDMRAGRDDEAQRLFQRAEDLARDEGLVHAEYAALQFRTYLDILFRRADEARARLARMEVHPARGHADAQMNLHLSHALLAQLQGRDADALAHAHRTLEAVERVGADYFKAVYTLSLVSVFADAGQFARAQQLVDAVRRLARGGYLEPMEAQMRLEEAYIAARAGDAARLHEHLRDGLALAAGDPRQAAYVHRIAARRPQLLVAALDAGIEPALARQLVRRWRVAPPADASDRWPWPVTVRTLGRFEVRVDDAPLAFGRKAPKKTLALLKAVIARGGVAGEGALVDQFWPDDDGDTATRSLGAAVHRLRTLLGVPEAVVQQGGQVGLDRAWVWVDAWAFERGLAAASPASVADALALYRGAFLADDDGESWPVAMRERLRGKFVRAVADHAAALEATQRPELALAWYLQGLDADPLVEPFYQGLMRCFHRLDRLPEALGAYRQLKQVLSATLGLAPSPGTDKLYQALQRG